MYRHCGGSGTVESLRVLVAIDVDNNNGATGDIGEGGLGTVEASRCAAGGSDHPFQRKSGFMGWLATSQWRADGARKVGGAGWCQAESVNWCRGHLSPLASVL